MLRRTKTVVFDDDPDTQDYGEPEPAALRSAARRGLDSGRPSLRKGPVLTPRETEILPQREAIPDEPRRNPVHERVDFLRSEFENEPISRGSQDSLAALRAGTPESGPTALVFRTGCSYRQRLEQLLTEFGWPPAARFELGTLDGMIGCVAAGMGVTLLPRAVVERNDQSGNIRIHPLSPAQSRVDTIFIRRRSAHQYSALQGFVACLENNSQVIAA